MARRHAVKAQSQRQLRVGETIRHVLAVLVERADFRNPVLSCARLTITEVRVSSDLRSATVFVVPLGGGDPASILDGLRRVRSFLRHELAHQIHLQFVPDLSFRADTRFDEVSHIEEILRRPDVQRDLQIYGEEKNVEGRERAGVSLSSFYSLGKFRKRVDVE